MNKIVSLLFLNLFIFSAHGKVQINENKWESILNEEGVKIFSQKIKGYDLIVFKTIYTLNASIENILALLRDAKHSVNWTHQLDKVEYISEKSDLEAIIYEVRKFPWPFSSRDFIVHYFLSINNSRKSLYLKFNSINHAKYSKNDKYVRAKINYGLFEFWPQGKKTKAELTLMADPGGAIPTWIVNIFQKNQPYDFLKTLEKEATNTRIPIKPGIKNIIEQYYQLYPTPIH